MKIFNIGTHLLKIELKWTNSSTSSGEEALAKVQGIEKHVEDFLTTKLPAQPDSDAIKKIKGLIRETEAWSAARYYGVKVYELFYWLVWKFLTWWLNQPDHIHNLHLPFYETGKVKKKPLGQEDIDIVKNLIDSIQPHQIYCAGNPVEPFFIVQVS